MGEGRLIYREAVRAALLEASAARVDTVVAQVVYLLRRGKVQVADLLAMLLLLPMAEVVLTEFLATYSPTKLNQGQRTATSFSFRSSAAPEEGEPTGWVGAADGTFQMRPLRRKPGVLLREERRQDANNGAKRAPADAAK